MAGTVDCSRNVMHPVWPWYDLGTSLLTMPVDTSNRVTWVVPLQLRQELAEVAADNDRTISAEARVALAAWIKQHKEKKAQ